MSEYDLATSLDIATPGFSNLVDENKAPGESWIDAATRLVSTVVSGYQQKQFMQINLDRARQGLPPLDPGNYGLGVSVGLSPEVKQMLIYGAVGIGALIYLTRSRRR